MSRWFLKQRTKQFDTYLVAREQPDLGFEKLLSLVCNLEILRGRGAFGVDVLIKKPTAAMRREAADARFAPYGIPVLQLLTVAEILKGTTPETPSPATAQAKAGRKLKAVR